MNAASAKAIADAKAFPSIKVATAGYSTQQIAERGKPTRWRVSQTISVDASDFTAAATLLSKLQDENGLLLSNMVLAGEPLVGGGDNRIGRSLWQHAQFHVDARSGSLDQQQRAQQLRRHLLAGNAEMLQRTLGLRAPEPVCGHLDRAEGIALHPVIRLSHVDCRRYRFNGLQTRNLAEWPDPVQHARDGEKADEQQKKSDHQRQ